MTLCIPIPHNHYEHSTSNLQSPSPSETVTLTPIKTIPIPQSTATTSGSGEKLMISCQPRLAKRIRTLGKWSLKLWPMKRLTINIHSALMNINNQSSTCWNITIAHTCWSHVIHTQPLLVSKSGLWNKCIITAWNMIYRRFGHTFGKTGTTQVDGTCGLVLAIQRSPYSKLLWYWKASKVL